MVPSHDTSKVMRHGNEGKTTSFKTKAKITYFIARKGKV